MIPLRYRTANNNFSARIEVNIEFHQPMRGAARVQAHVHT